MSSPQISIIIPAYNAEKIIGKCLESLFAQTHKDFEILVVDDGSTDDTLQALEPYKNRIIVISQANGGAPAARNKGFLASKGPYVLFSDADIIWRPDALEKLFNALKKAPEAAYAYPSFKLGKKHFRLWPFDGGKLKQVNYIHTSALLRREFFPGFDESLKKFQDWDLWLTILERGGSGVWVSETLFRVAARGTMSAWMPKIFYKIPWDSLGWKPKAMEKYEYWKKVVQEKHRISG